MAIKYLMYSYKGGTGRTVATSHVAVSLARGAEFASKGKKVAVVDLDIEGPGLRVLFDINPKKKLFIQNYFKDPDNFDIDKALINIPLEENYKGDDEVLGKLSILSASNDYNLQVDLDYYTLVDRVNTLCEHIENMNYDIILFDMPSGYGNMTKAALRQRDIIVVMLFRWSRQHLVGTMTMSKFFMTLKLPFILVPSAVSPAMDRYIKASYETYLYDRILESSDDSFRDEIKIRAEVPEDETLKWNEHILFFDKEYPQELSKDVDSIIPNYNNLALQMLKKYRGK